MENDNKYREELNEYYVNFPAESNIRWSPVKEQVPDTKLDKIAMACVSWIVAMFAVGITIAVWALIFLFVLNLVR